MPLLNMGYSDLKVIENQQTQEEAFSELPFCD